MHLDELQQQAVDLCLDKKQRIVAITGAAGTGKTTIIKEVVDVLRKNSIPTAIAAPTGKAARRITQATGHAAVTLHRLLEYPRPGQRDAETGKPLNPGQPKRDYNKPLDYDVVIVDEYAMVNTELDRNVLDALRRGARLLVFGDVNQLPPIEQSKSLTVGQTPFEKHLQRASVRLEHIYRQAEGSDILYSANQIRLGRMPRKGNDFHYAMTNDPVKRLSDYIVEAELAGVNYRLPQNQIITPQKSSWIGTIALNSRLRDLLNPHGVSDYSLDLPRNRWDHHDVYISVGDKVICTENTYDMRDYNERYDDTPLMDKITGDRVEKIGKEAYYIEPPPHMMMLNGETGNVTAIHGDGAFEVDFGDRVVHVPHDYAEWNFKSQTMYPVDPRKRIDLAYAVTTHKCQGSEFERVIYMMNKSCQFMLNRNNFYTAVTRAKSKVIIFTDEKGLHAALRPLRRD